MLPAHCQMANTAINRMRARGEQRFSSGTWSDCLRWCRPLCRLGVVSFRKHTSKRRGEVCLRYLVELIGCCSPVPAGFHLGLWLIYLPVYKVLFLHVGDESDRLDGSTLYGTLVDDASGVAHRTVKVHEQLQHPYLETVPRLRMHSLRFAYFVCVYE